MKVKGIVSFFEAFLHNKDTELCIIMEFCGSGDLAGKIDRYKKRRQYINERVVCFLFLCTLSLSLSLSLFL